MSAAPIEQDPHPDPAPGSPVALLGETRARLVTYLRRHREAGAAELAEHLGISEAATRRHLGVLELDGLITSRTVRQDRGRPAARYHLTEAATALFPHHYDQLASEALAFLTDQQGRNGMHAFLRWRLERQVDELKQAVTAPDLPGRLRQLAAALSAAGFEASVDPDGTGFRLTQDHCAIEGIAREHPEVCAYEAATFSEVLGDDVELARRATLAGGARACVCAVTPRTDPRPSP